MKIVFVIITLITFGLFFIEAIVHYNEGRVEMSKLSKKALSECIGEFDTQTDFDNFSRYFGLPGGMKIYIPENKELVKLLFTIIFFSAINGLISTFVISLHLG